MPMQYVWLLVMIVAAIVEAATAQLVSIWIVAGGLAGVITSFFTDNIFIQCAVFLLVVIISLIIFMPLVKKSRYFQKSHTNADRCVGKEAIVTTTINNVLGEGQVVVLGNVWSARSSDDTIIQKDHRVRIERISGVKLIVAPIEDIDDEGEND